MQKPPEIAFRHVDARDELKSLVLEGIEKLETIYPGIISCRAVIENVTPDRRTGNDYRVHLEIGVPNHTVVVDKHDPPEAVDHRDLAQAIHRAFDVARKRLQKTKDLQRGDVKTQALPPHGRVTALQTAGDGVRYGFIEARDGKAIYFQASALVGLDYDALEIGDEVRYVEAGGNEGPQATTVAPLDRREIGRIQDRSIPLP